jgi:adenosylhomocysteinase
MAKEGQPIEISFTGKPLAEQGSAKGKHFLEEGGEEDLGGPNKKARLNSRERPLLEIGDNSNKGFLSPYYKGGNLDKSGSETPDTIFSLPVVRLGAEGQSISDSSRTTPFDNSDQGDTTVLKSKLDSKSVDLFSGYRIEETSEERKNHEKFFGCIIDKLDLNKVENAQLVIVMHMFPDAYPFLGAMEKVVDIGMIIAKPNSKMRDIVEGLEQKGYPIMHLKRDSIGNIADSILTNKKTVFADHGGYFPSTIRELQQALGDNFVGALEHTENGYKRFLSLSPDFPFYSVARSSLKEYEDRRVGRSIADATGLVLESLGVNIKELKNGTIGYGKLGRAYSKSMRKKGVDVVISELKKDRAEVAEKEEFKTIDTDVILTESDLICVANGDKAITGKQFASLKKGAYVASVTSHDDAFDRSWLDSPESGYKKTQHPNSEYVTLYNNPETGHYFHLIADGNPINLVHKITVGERILLGHAESLVAIHRLLTNQAQIGECNIDDETRNLIRDTWIEAFGEEALKEDYEETSEENDERDGIETLASSEWDKSKGHIIFQAP